MYAAFLATIVGCFAGFLIPSVSAFSLSPATPQNYGEVERELEKIPPELEKAQCGGWDDRSASGTIATVRGVPGRNGVWNGNIRSGMATRKDDNGNTNIDDDFQFPDTTAGLTTACSPDKKDIPKTVWKEKKPEEGGLPGEVWQVSVTFPHPQFQDPPCRWRPKEGDGFRDTAPDNPLKELQEYDPVPEYGELKAEGEDRQSPPNCENLCKLLNSYQYYDCLETGRDDTNTYDICKRWGNKFLCSDAPADQSNQSCSPGVPATGKPNAQGCLGAQCRCQGDSGPQINGCVQNPSTDPNVSRVYYSYYRFYKGEYSRDKVETDDGDKDIATDEAEVACYGFYNEFDPKTHFTGITDPLPLSKDRRCVINFDKNGSPIEERRETQELKGEYGQNSSLPDRDPNTDGNQRTPPGQNRTAGAFNGDQDLWYLKLGGGFSLLNEKVFSGSYNNQLTNVFLNIGAVDTAVIRATEQLGVRRPFASGSFIRAFDDTGDRIVTSWWQTQQSAMASVLHPPIIRMILPSGWALGIDPDDPFFAANSVKVLKPLDKREGRIEVQINAADDTLGAALAYLQRSLLLHVVEEPVPAVIPVGSAVEFRGKAEAWCAWYMRRENKQNCDDAPPEVKTLIETLETYATDIEQYRLLRTELATYAGKILAIQQSVTKPVSDWMIDNIDAYQEFLTQQRLLQQGMGKEWRTVQEKMETFGSTTNLPWCMNQRFTMPVYSLLDDWMPSRKDGGKRTASGLTVISVDADADVVIDLSAIAFMSGSVTLPVLQPVQVRVTDFPLPPSPQDEKPLPVAYPELPRVTIIRDALKRAADALPKPYSSSGMSIPPIGFEPVDRAVTEARLQAVRDTGTIIDKMDERYKKFWKSIGPFKPNDPDPDFDPDNKKGIAYKKPLLECETWDDNTCQHVEMDLRERFQRIGSRPLVFLKEDYTSKDEERGIGAPCVGQSDVCTPMHPEEGGETHLWEIIGPRTIKDIIDELRTDIRKATLPEPVGDIDGDDSPRYGTDTGNLLPVYTVPPPVDLTPPASSSSSSTRTNP
jgi:hypothetical protein